MQLGHYLGLAALLFGIGAAGFLLRRNLVLQLMSVELMLNATNLLLVAFNRWQPENSSGQSLAFLVIAVAAAEAGVGLAIALSVFRHLGRLDGDRLNRLRG